MSRKVNVLVILLAAYCVCITFGHPSTTIKSIESTTKGLVVDHATTVFPIKSNKTEKMSKTIGSIKVTYVIPGTEEKLFVKPSSNSKEWIMKMDKTELTTNAPTTAQPIIKTVKPFTKSTAAIIPPVVMTEASTVVMSEAPMTKPATVPTVVMTEATTVVMTEATTVVMTEAKTVGMTEAPTVVMSEAPMTEPATVPTVVMTEATTVDITEAPTTLMTERPMTNPPTLPTVFITETPMVLMTEAPTEPTVLMTKAPTVPTVSMTIAPTVPIVFMTESPTKVTDVRTVATICITETPADLITKSQSTVTNSAKTHTNIADQQKYDSTIQVIDPTTPPKPIKMLFTTTKDLPKTIQPNMLTAPSLSVTVASVTPNSNIKLVKDSSEISTLAPVSSVTTSKPLANHPGEDIPWPEGKLTEFPSIIRTSTTENMVRPTAPTLNAASQNLSPDSAENNILFSEPSLASKRDASTKNVEYIYADNSLETAIINAWIKRIKPIISVGNVSKVLTLDKKGTKTGEIIVNPMISNDDKKHVNKDCNVKIKNHSIKSSIQDQKRIKDIEDAQPIEKIVDKVKNAENPLIGLKKNTFSGKNDFDKCICESGTHSLHFDNSHNEFNINVDIPDEVFEIEHEPQPHIDETYDFVKKLSTCNEADSSLEVNNPIQKTTVQQKCNSPSKSNLSPKPLNSPPKADTNENKKSRSSWEEHLILAKTLEEELSIKPIVVVIDPTKPTEPIKNKKGDGLLVNVNYKINPNIQRKIIQQPAIDQLCPEESSKDKDKIEKKEFEQSILINVDNYDDNFEVCKDFLKEEKSDENSSKKNEADNCDSKENDMIEEEFNSIEKINDKRTPQRKYRKLNNRRPIPYSQSIVSYDGGFVEYPDDEIRSSRPLVVQFNSPLMSGILRATIHSPLHKQAIRKHVKKQQQSLQGKSSSKSIRHPYYSNNLPIHRNYHPMAQPINHPPMIQPIHTSYRDLVAADPTCASFLPNEDSLESDETITDYPYNDNPNYWDHYLNDFIFNSRWLNHGNNYWN